MDAIGSYLFILFAMVAATFVSRFPMLYFAGRRGLPTSLRIMLDYIPPAVLISIAAPAVLIRDNKPVFSSTNEYLVASIVTALVAWRTKKMILSIAVGMLSLWGWRFLLTLLF